MWHDAKLQAERRYRFPKVVVIACAMAMALLGGAVNEMHAASRTEKSIKLLQHRSIDNGSTTTSSLAVTMKAVGRGHLLTCSLTYGNHGGTTLTVSDNLNGIWLVANPPHYDPTIVQTTAQFYLPDSKGGDTTITGQPGSPFAWGAMNCQEWSGVATSNPLDQNTQQEGSTDDPSSGNVTTSSADELILGDLMNVASPRAGKGFTYIDTSPATHLASEYQIQAAPGSVAGNWQAPATSWTAQVATFRGSTNTNTPPSVQLNWVASSSSDVVGYNVYRSTVSGGPYSKLVTSLVSGATYTDDTVEAGKYYYVVTAIGSNGVESSYSNQALVNVP